MSISTELIELKVLGKLHIGSGISFLYISLGVALVYFLHFPTPTNTEPLDGRGAVASS